MPARARATIIGLLLAASVVPFMRPAFAAFSDVPSGYWATPAIKAVAIDHDWMRDYGTSYFRPTSPELKKLFARALVRAFKPADPALQTPSPQPTPDPSLSPSPDPSVSPSPDPSVSPSPPPDPRLAFTDVPKTDPYYPSIDLVVRLGWMSAPGGTFRPNDAMPKWFVDLTLLNALGLKDDIAGLRTIRTADGRSFNRSTPWAAIAIATEMRLHYNHPTSAEKLEMGPATIVPRAELAWSLTQAVQARNSWRLNTAHQFRSIVLPNMDWQRRRTLEFAFNYVGFPYVYGGEWYKATGSGFCCGAQPVGGFDCSGFTWWVLQRASASFPVTQVRPYSGWAVPQRTSYDMARLTTTRISYAALKPMDLMFFRSDLSRRDWVSVDHVGLYIGSGWMIHSSGGRAGVTLSRVGDGWWREHFVFGRRIMP